MTLLGTCEIFFPCSYYRGLSLGLCTWDEMIHKREFTVSQCDFPCISPFCLKSFRISFHFILSSVIYFSSWFSFAFPFCCSVFLLILPWICLLSCSGTSSDFHPVLTERTSQLHPNTLHCVSISEKRKIWLLPAKLSELGLTGQWKRGGRSSFYGFLLLPDIHWFSIWWWSNNILISVHLTLLKFQQWHSHLTFPKTVHSTGFNDHNCLHYESLKKLCLHWWWLGLRKESWCEYTFQFSWKAKCH